MKTLKWLVILGGGLAIAAGVSFAGEIRIQESRQVGELVARMTLQQKQARFSVLVARLILKAEEFGYEVSLGEAWRSLEVANFQTKKYADQGKGIVESLHRVRLAIDINLFIKATGQYLSRSEDYRRLGEWWESQSDGQIRCTWGGRFRRADGNHFSIEHEGRK